MKSTGCIFFALLLSYHISFSQTGWYQQSTNNGFLWSVSFVDENTGWIVGDGGIIKKTTNGGDNWVSQTANSSSLLSYVQFLNTQTGYIIGHNSTILKTTNGGTNWTTQIMSTTGNFFQCSFVNPSTGWISGDPGIYKTTNGGQNWLPNKVDGRNYYGVFFKNENYGWTEDITGNMYYTTNGGQNWNSQYNTNYIPIVSFHFINLNTGWAVGYGNSIYKTTNGGQTYVQQTAPSGSSQLRSVWFVDTLGQKGWVSGYFGTLYKTTNSGSVWTQVSLNLGTSDFNCVRFIGNSKGWIVTSGGQVIHTNTGGEMVPPVPNLIYPPNNSVEISKTPLMRWGNSSGATYYRFQISTIPDFSVINDSITTSNIQYGIPSGKLSGGVTYFWRVCAGNAIGMGPWSNVWNFATVAGPVAPVLISPANNSANISLTPTLTWNSSATSVLYHVQVSTDSIFTVILDSLSTTLLQRTVPSGKLTTSLTYYWRVRGYNNFGAGEWSTVWHFTTYGIPVAPVLVSPANGTIGVNLTPTLTWNISPGATNYRIQISTISNFSLISDSATVSSTQYTVPGGKLINLYTYFWRVCAFNQYGISPWSSTWQFTVNTNSITQLNEPVPTEFKLYDNYPNPFNPATKIKFDLPKDSKVTINIYDISGKKITGIINNELKKAGAYSFEFNGESLASGVYFYKIYTGDFSQTKRMILIK